MSTDGNISASTIVWPAAMTTSSSVGTVEYAIEHPTTFIKGISNTYYDWHYITESELWKSDKTVYDPCPAGYRVPDGDVWHIANGTTYWDFRGLVLGGRSFSGKFGEDPSIWYPASGSIKSGELVSLGQEGIYWSNERCKHSSYSGQTQLSSALCFAFNGTDVSFMYSGTFTTDYYRARGNSVRCQKEE